MCRVRRNGCGGGIDRSGDGVGCKLMVVVKLECMEVE